MIQNSMKTFEFSKILHQMRRRQCVSKQSKKNDWIFQVSALQFRLSVKIAFID